MPIGRFKIYLVGNPMDTEIGMKLGKLLAEELGFPHLVFKEVQRARQINFAETLSVWLFPYSSTLEDETREIIAECRGFNIPLEKLRGGTLVNQSRIWEALKEGTEQELRA